jgi:deoxycytidine triphosphate deaminase
MSVLSHTEIKDNFDSIFVANGNIENIDAAKYYLTLGEDFLILPSGEKYSELKRRQRPFVIQPGQTAFVSTAERLIMPSNLIGILGPSFGNTEHGVLFFGGMLVDPGYGMHGEGEAAGTPGQPLSFNIANVSDAPLEVRPGEDTIASIAFIRIDNPVGEKELRDRFPKDKAIEAREELFADKKSRRPTRALGIVEDLGQVRAELDRLQASVNQVVLLVVVILAVTLCAAVTAVVFELTGELNTANPNGTTEPIWKTVGLTLACIVGAVIAIVAVFYAALFPLSKLVGLRRRRRLSD